MTQSRSTSQCQHSSRVVLPSRFDGRSPKYHQWRATRIKHATLQCGDNQIHSESRASSENQISEKQAPTIHCLSPQLKTGQSTQHLDRLCESIRITGYAVYTFDESPSDPVESVNSLHQSLNLEQHDTGVVTSTAGLSLLEDLKGTAKGRFIPYSNRAMNWHTDGYYNSDEQTIRCFSLHCIEPALAGGALTVMDYELLLIALYDDDPELVSILAHPEAMVLPANTDNLGHNRPDRAVPMIYTHADETLGMRFTARTKYIIWRTPETELAAQRALELIHLNSTQQVTIKLTRGQGLITRNILHRRDAFTDSPNGPKRQMLRGRFTQLPGKHNTRSDGFSETGSDPDSEPGSCEPEASPSPARGDSNAPG